MQFTFPRILAVALLALASTQASADSKPIMCRVGEGVGPGNAVLISGGGMSDTKIVRYWRVDNDAPGEPTEQAPLTMPRAAAFLPALQPTEGSLKFILPADELPGVFAATLMVGEETIPPILINRPELWFLQPTTLQPGLEQNQSAAGATVQIVGKTFLLPGDKGEPLVAIRSTAAGAKWAILKPTRAEVYSLLVDLPKDLAAGDYELRAHNSFGGPVAWSAPLKIQIKAADVWPTRIFNVKELGAVGDDVHDDTAAVRKVLKSAEENGGGVVYFPYGTYRFTDWICIPPHTTVRGEGRDITILKWPVDEPKTAADFTPAAIYGASPYAVEDLTIIVRKVDTGFLDLSYEQVSHIVPAELAPKLKPWGEDRDAFFRRVHFQHWIDCGHPEKNPDLAKKYWQGANNILFGGMRNLEVSDCIFQGGDNRFTSIRHGRLTGNNFSNTMNYCWTVLGGGAHYVVCQNNEINASSSWGWGWTGMKYVYSAHNISRNFVRGEREAMTLDISALPTARPAWQYWGAPVELANTEGNIYLKFPPPSQASPDGFHTGFTPGCFKGGTATIHAYTGGPGANQTRQILDNTADTVTLDKPWNTAPDTVQRKLYIEIAPRHAKAHIGTTAWVGHPESVNALSLKADKADWVPDEFIGMSVLILDGPGAGQYRDIVRNSANELTLDRAWDVPPTAASAIGVWSLMRHMIVFDSQGYDTSAFAQLYGNFYDYTVDRCHAERTQGIWGQGGWYVSLLNNDISVGYTFQPGIGPGGGSNPEKCVPFGITGLLDGDIRLTKGNSFQYDSTGKPLFINELLGAPVPGILGATIRGNSLHYNQRVGFQISSIGHAADAHHLKAQDVIIDSNSIDHSPVGIQIGPNIGGTLITGNHYKDVAEPRMLAKPENVVVKDADPQ